MALQGTYDYKGLTVASAYLQVTSFHYELNQAKESVLKTQPVLDEDGTILEHATFEDQWIKSKDATCFVRVFKDKESREENPHAFIEAFDFSFEVSLAATAKNHLKQAYAALKKIDAYKDYTDV